VRSVGLMAGAKLLRVGFLPRVAADLRVDAVLPSGPQALGRL